MIRVTTYIKPHRLEAVKSAIAALGVTGMSVADVRGTGNSREESEILGGQLLDALPIRARIDVVVPDEMAEGVVSGIQEAAFTGDLDDGKIFLEAVEDALRIRTMERGDAAV